MLSYLSGLLHNTQFYHSGLLHNTLSYLSGLLPDTLSYLSCLLHNTLSYFSGLLPNTLSYLFGLLHNTVLPLDQCRLHCPFRYYIFQLQICHLICKNCCNMTTKTRLMKAVQWSSQRKSMVLTKLHCWPVNTRSHTALTSYGPAIVNCITYQARARQSWFNNNSNLFMSFPPVLLPP